MFAVVLFTTMYKPAVPGHPVEPANVNTTIIPGFETGELATRAAQLLNNTDLPGIDRRCVVIQMK